MKKRYSLIIVLIFVAGFLFFFYHQRGIDIVSSVPAIKSVTSNIAYDKSIPTEYGKPIKVARVIDGDTVELINGDRLRYIGMDTPEEVDPQKPVQCYAKEAAERNQELVEGKNVTIYKDVSEKDKYGRYLGFVYLPDGTFVNKELVTEGFAFAYPYRPDISKKAEFATAQLSAKSQDIGLWAHCTVSVLSSGKEQTNAVQ